MMNLDETNIKLSDQLEQTKKECLTEVEALNIQKIELLKAFLKEIHELEPLPLPFFYSYSEIEAIWYPYELKIHAIGGKISGLTRKYKSAIAMYMLTLLVEKNKKYFDYYTSMNFQLYSKFIFNTSPTKKSLLPLINNTIPWQKKNEEMPHLATKKRFMGYLMFSESLTVYSEEEYKLLDRFNHYYDAFKIETEEIKTRYKLEYLEHKKNVYDIFKNTEQNQKQEK